MNREFNLDKYLQKGVENVLKGAIRATLKNPSEGKFMASFALASKKAMDRREKIAKTGTHVPPFLIASITSSCNLHCKGCYARENQGCTDSLLKEQLTTEQWGTIFEEAYEMGVSFILLAGGEPFIRKDVIEKAGSYKDILFPIFTNGTMMTQQYIELFKTNRNLVPVFSIEGDLEKTDSRRGSGTYDYLMKAMNAVKNEGLIFGVSVTVTTGNVESVMSETFLQAISSRGCKAVIYVEYVPVTEESKALAFKDEDREVFTRKLETVRRKYSEMVFISFPGDEKSSGGCLAAGRGFFHINSTGGAEPCPFSPYSDINVADTSLREALDSNLFQALHNGQLLMEDHSGGCVLFEKKGEVERILMETSKK